MSALTNAAAAVALIDGVGAVDDTVTTALGGLAESIVTTECAF